MFFGAAGEKGVDGRDEPGHDGEWVVARLPSHACAGSASAATLCALERNGRGSMRIEIY